MLSSITVLDITPNGLFSKFLLPSVFRKRIRETRFKQEWKMETELFNLLRMGWNGEDNPKKWYAQYSKRFNGPKYQRGNFSMFPAGSTAATAPTGGSVVLTNHSFSSSDFGNLVTSRAAFLSTGELSHTDDGTPTSVQAGEWHSDEPSSTGADYEVRYTSASKTGDAYTTPAAAGDTWIRIDAERSWGHRIIAKSSPDTLSSTATFELGDYLASSADDSATLTITAEN